MVSNVSNHNEALLRAILAVTARQTFPPDRLTEIVMAKGASTKQVAAFNLCDGSRGQGEIAKALKLDQGNFSKTVARWIEAGVLFRLGVGREAKLLHVYPLAEAATKKKGARS